MNEIEMRELDAWIAEHVFAIKRLDESWMQAEAVSVWKNQPDCRVFLAGFSAWPSENKEDGPTVAQDWPPYTTSRGTALKVLEKCAEKTMVSCWRSKRQTLNGWVVDNRHHQGLNGFLESAETLSLAICLFAKKLFS